MSDEKEVSERMQLLIEDVLFMERILGNNMVRKWFQLMPPDLHCNSFW